jgi:hypothetical protein
MILAKEKAMHAELHDKSKDFLYLDIRRPTLWFVGRTEGQRQMFSLAWRGMSYRRSASLL